MSKTATGRMINADISDSENFAALSEKAAVLFCLLIPHFSAHGKMKANGYYIKGLVCPKVPYLTPENIPALLQEISKKTNVKYWTDQKGEYLQSLRWEQEQDLRADRMGKDRLPDWPVDFIPDNSGSTPGLVRREVEVEVEGEVEILPPGMLTHTTPLGAKAKRAPNRKTLVPDDWQPSERFDAWLRENHPDIGFVEREQELRRFKDYCHANGKKYADHEAALRNWFNSPYRQKKDDSGLYGHTTQAPATGTMIPGNRIAPSSERKGGVLEL